MVRFGDGTEVAAHAVIVATGVSYRDLDAPGVAELSGRGVYYGSAATEAAACVGRRRLHRRRRQLGRPGGHVLLQGRQIGHPGRAGGLVERGMSHYLIEQLQAMDNVSVRP